MVHFRSAALVGVAALLTLPSMALAQGAGSQAADISGPAAVPAAPVPPAAMPVTVPTPDPQRMFLQENARKPGWRVRPSGLQYRQVVRRPASPQIPGPKDRITIHYEGKLIDGTIFDSTYAENVPATLPLDRTIRGWQEGLSLMRVGETWEFAIPSTLAYGAVGKGPIPGGATLLFKVELLATEAPPRETEEQRRQREAQEEARKRKRE